MHSALSRFVLAYSTRQYTICEFLLPEGNDEAYQGERRYNRLTDLSHMTVTDAKDINTFALTCRAFRRASRTLGLRNMVVRFNDSETPVRLRPVSMPIAHFIIPARTPCAIALSA